MLRFIVAGCVVGLVNAAAVAQPCLGLQTVGELIDVTPGPEAIRFGATVAFSETSQRYVVVFGESKPEPNANDLFSQVLDAEGGLVGGVNPVIEQEGSQASHVMTWNSVNNEFLVAWESQASGGFSSDGRRIGTDGAPLAGAFDLGAAGNELALAFGASTYLFTQRSGGIDGQRLSPAAALIGDVLDIGIGGPNGNIVFDNLNNRFLSVFRGQVGDDFEIRARIVNPDGSFATDPFVVANEFPNQVRAAFDGVNRRYLIVFNAAEDNSLRGVFIDENGGPSGPSFLIADEEINFLEVAHNPAGNAFVIVADSGGRDASPKVLAFAVDGDGTVGRDRVVLSTTGGDPAIALNAAGGECLAVWSEGQSRSDSRIVARRLAFGEPACSPFSACGAGLCGIGLCGGGFAPMLPVTLAAMGWLKLRRRRRRAWSGWKMKHHSSPSGMLEGIPLRIALLCTGLVSLLSARAAAQPCLGLQAVGDPIEVTPRVDPGPTAPVVAYSVTSQRYLVVFVESADDVNSSDIFSQVLGTDGTRIGGEENSVIDQAGFQGRAAIAWNSVNDEFLVSWESQEIGNQISDARRIGTDGAALAEPFELASVGDSQALAFGASTYFFTERNAGIGIPGRLLSAAATPLAAQFDVSGVGRGAPNGNIAFDSLNGRFLSIWRDQDPAIQNIKARIVRPDGSFATDPFEAVPEFPGDVRAVFDEQNRRYLILFNDFESRFLRGRFMDENGATPDPSFPILDERAELFEVAFNPAAGAFVVVATTFRDVGERSAARDVIAIAIRSDGVVGTDRVVLAAGNASGPAIAFNPVNGDCLAVWEENSADVAGSQIRGQRLTFGEPDCPVNFGCGAGLCGIGICGGGFAPMMPVTLAAMVWMKRRRGLKVRLTL